MINCASKSLFLSVKHSPKLYKHLSYSEWIAKSKEWRGGIAFRFKFAEEYKIKLTNLNSCIVAAPTLDKQLIINTNILSECSPLKKSSQNSFPLFLPITPKNNASFKFNGYCVVNKCGFSSSSSHCNKSKENNFWKKGIIFTSLGAAVILGTLAVKEINNINNEKIAQEVPNVEELTEKFPKHSSDLPNFVKYLVIGAGASAFSACRTIKSRDATAQILMLSEEPFYPYMKPPLSKELFFLEDAETFKFKQWNGTERSIFYENEEFYLPCEKLSESETGGIAVARGWSVVSIDPQSRIVSLEDGKSIKYDKCLLATGSSPKKLQHLRNLPRGAQDKITYYHTLSDFNTVERITKGDAKSIVVYGSGFLGCELATAISKRGLKNGVRVTQIVENSSVMEDVLPPYLCDWVKTKIEEGGVNFINKCFIEDVILESGQLNIKLSNGLQVKADQLLICVGSMANTDLAVTSGLEVDENNGGFLVNPELEARSHLFAAGDCASYYDNILEKRRVVPHYDHAIASGRLAGENMTGAAKPMVHQAMLWTELGADVGFEAVGCVSTDLRTVGVFADSNARELSSTEESKNFKHLDFSKGVVFYLNRDIIEGILLWNLYHRLPIARQFHVIDLAGSNKIGATQVECPIQTNLVNETEASLVVEISINFLGIQI